MKCYLTNQLNRDNIYDKEVILRFFEFQHKILRMIWSKSNNEYANVPVKVNIGRQLFDIDHIDTVIDMDSNKPNIVIHVKEN